MVHPAGGFLPKTVGCGCAAYIEFTTDIKRE
jgi:hypothetical protein